MQQDQIRNVQTALHSRCDGDSARALLVACQWDTTKAIEEGLSQIGGGEVNEQQGNQAGLEHQQRTPNHKGSLSSSAASSKQASSAAGPSTLHSDGPAKEPKSGPTTVRAKARASTTPTSAAPLPTTHTGNGSKGHPQDQFGQDHVPASVSRTGDVARDGGASSKPHPGRGRGPQGQGRGRGKHVGKDPGGAG